MNHVAASASVLDDDWIRYLLSAPATWNREDDLQLQLNQANHRNRCLLDSLEFNMRLSIDLNEKLEASQESLKSVNQLLTSAETKQKKLKEELRQIKRELGMSRLAAPAGRVPTDCQGRPRRLAAPKPAQNSSEQSCRSSSVA